MIRCVVCWRIYGGRPLMAMLKGWVRIDRAWVCLGCRRPRRW